MTFMPSTLEEALLRLDALRDPSARELAREALAAVVDYHAEGLRRLSERLRDAGEDGARLLQRALDDEVVASMFLLHGVHPLPLDARVRRALARVRVSDRGAGVEVLAIDDAAIRVRVTGTETLRASVLRALEEAAPEVDRIEIVQADGSDLIPLERLTSKREANHDRCELCGQSLAEEHDHVFDLERRRPRCACAACNVLLDTGSGPIRRVRRQARRLEQFRMDDAQWKALEVPVGLAFFSYSSLRGEVIAAYPGPAGTTESMVPRSAWSEIVAQNPVLADLEPDIMALLVDRRTPTAAFHIISIDECYRLAGLVRQNWSGRTGGDGPGRVVAEFLGGLLEARP